MPPRKCTFPIPHNPKYQCPRPGTHHQPSLHTHYCRSHDRHAHQRCRVRIHWRGKGERCVELSASNSETSGVCEEHAHRVPRGRKVVQLEAEEGRTMISDGLNTVPAKDVFVDGVTLPVNSTTRLHLATPVFTAFEHSALATTAADVWSRDEPLLALREQPVPALDLRGEAQALVVAPDCGRSDTCVRKGRVRVDSLAPLALPIDLDGDVVEQAGEVDDVGVVHKKRYEMRPYTPSPHDGASSDDDQQQSQIQHMDSSSSRVCTPSPCTPSFSAASSTSSPTSSTRTPPSSLPSIYPPSPSPSPFAKHTDTTSTHLPPPYTSPISSIAQCTPPRTTTSPSTLATPLSRTTLPLQTPHAPPSLFLFPSLFGAPPLVSTTTPPPPPTPTTAALYAQCCICLEKHTDYNMRTVPRCGHVYRALCRRKMGGVLWGARRVEVRRGEKGKEGVEKFNDKPAESIDTTKRRWNCGACREEFGGLGRCDMFSS